MSSENERPDGGLSGVLWDMDQRVSATRRHAVAEGHDVDTRTVLDSYDRTLHPWMHGRRPHDLADRAREWLQNTRNRLTDDGGDC